MCNDLFDIEGWREFCVGYCRSSMTGGINQKSADRLAGPNAFQRQHQTPDNPTHNSGICIMSEIEDSKESPSDISFVVTGFGPFRGVANNPSTVLVHELKSFLETHDEAGLATRLQKCFVFETSAQDVRAKIDEICLQPNNSTITIYLHLGVNYKGIGFQLEKCAWNDATFRIPDEQGFQPRNKTIVDEAQLNARCDTQIDIEKLFQNQTEIHSSIESKCSIDPGRFVCNYLYFYSLSKLQSTSKTSMFLHVPPFSVVEKDAQLAYISSLMRKMVELYSTKEGRVVFPNPE